MLVGQPEPQSCAKRPTPRIPFAPNSSRLFEGGKSKSRQPSGTAVLVPTASIGVEPAFSPAISTSAVCTGPHVYPLSNGKHSNTGLPSVAFCCGRATVSADDRILNPELPVSTNMLSTA